MAKSDDDGRQTATFGGRSLTVVGVAVVAALMAILSGGGSLYNDNYNDDKNPYFAPSTSSLFIPLSLVYTSLAHVWLWLIFGGGGSSSVVNNNNIIITPMPALSPSTTTKKKKKVMIITGANTGIGYETARTLVTTTPQEYYYHYNEYGYSSKNNDVILACRSKDKALEAQQQINKNNNNIGNAAVVLDAPLDLSDFNSIQRFVQEVATKYEHIDVVINNAGRNTSGSGNTNDLDLMFTSNYLGHFYLCQLLMEAGLLKHGSRIVNLSSVMHHFSKDAVYGIETVEYWKSRAVIGFHQNIGNADDDDDDDNDYNMPDGVYSATKLAAILHCVEWNRRYDHIPCIAVNPGAVNSDIWRGFPDWMRAIFARVYLTTQQGSVPLVAAAVRDDWKKAKDNKGDVVYLQPYWIPSFSSSELQQQQQSLSSRSPMAPFTEMLGPYVGYVSTAPRLPSDGGQKAAKVLWQVSEELLFVQQQQSS